MAGTPALSCCEALGLSRGFTVVTGVDWMSLWDEADVAAAEDGDDDDDVCSTRSSTSTFSHLRSR